MKILLCYICPPRERDDYYISLLPYGLFSIAAYLDSLNKYSITLANFSKIGVSKGAVLAVDESPDIIGVSIFSFNRDISLLLIKKIKQLLPNAKIFIGGHHATFLADELLGRCPEIDFIIKGEGEELTAECIDKLNRGQPIKKIVSGSRIQNLDKLPLPSDYKGKLIGVNNNEQQKIIITTRGCPNNCTFCSSPAFWSCRVAFRSPASVSKEIINIRKRFGIIYFSVRDDNFTVNKKHVLETSAALAASNLYMMWNCQARVDTIDIDMLLEMKAAGLEHIQLGVESGSPAMLAKYNKNITREKIVDAAKAARQAGVYLSIYLMTGMVNETQQDVEQTVDIIEQIKPHDGIVSPVAYYPGTALYNEMKAKGKITDDVWFNTDDNALLAREDKQAKKSMMRLLTKLENMSERAFYTPSDFEKHRKKDGGLWITNIMEGDYYFDEGDMSSACNFYDMVIKEHPENIWGYMRVGKAQAAMKEYKQAAATYSKAIEIVPNFFGAYLKAGETLLHINKKKEAYGYAQTALKLNPYDERVKRLWKKISFA